MPQPVAVPHPRLADLLIALVFQSGVWRYISPAGPFGRYDYRVDALNDLPQLEAKLRRRGWEGQIDVLVQEPWGEMVPLAYAP